MAASLVVRLLLLLLLLRGGSPSSGERERERGLLDVGGEGAKAMWWVGGWSWILLRKKGGGGKGPSSSAYRGIKIYHRTYCPFFFLLLSRTKAMFRNTTSA